MNIIISNNSNVPIYEQIKQNIIKQILDGTLKENENLPSIRALSKDIRISVMTIKKAYDELEEQGYIQTIHGKGSFVSSNNHELEKEEKLKKIEEYINNIVEISKYYKIDKKEIINKLNELYGDEE